MRVRGTRRAVAGALVCTLACAWVAPASASAMPAAQRSAVLAKELLAGPMAPRRGLGASSIPASSSPLPASPATGTLDAATASDDLFAVDLVAGQRLTLELTAGAATDYDLYLYWPNATELSTFAIAAAAVATSYPDTLQFDAARAGTYYVNVHAWTGEGPYSLTWSVGPATATPVVRRMAGATRYDTALQISSKTFAEQPSHDVVLVSGEKFPDALSASGLAGVLGCPLLLTRKASLSAGVLAEIQRLGVADVHIVGGTAAVSTDVEDALTGAGYTVYRYGGGDRYATSAVVARAAAAMMRDTPEMAFVVRGDAFPDALSVAPIAYQHAFPVLLTRSAALSPAAAGVMTDLSIPKVIIAGGTMAVSSDVESAVRGLPSAPRVERVAGATRYGTATEVVRLAVREYLATPSDLGIASGTGFADALSGGSSTGVRGGLMLLTYKTRLAAETRDLLAEYGGLDLVDTVTIYGGTAAIESKVQDAVLEALQ